MQLRRLDVSNIRSFESGRLDLGPGTTLLVGDVGAGKSSLLYAIEMALFGVAEVDAAFLVRHGTSHAEVGVTLADRDHSYVVRRRFRKVRRRGKETYEPERLTFAEDGQPTAYSATEIRQRVIDLLGFPDNPSPQAHSDLWRWAIYVPQERMREILAADPEDRLETVRKALGVERYRTAAENAGVLSSDLRTGARHRREEADRLAHWDAEFAEVTREADRLRLERTVLASTLGREEEALTAARAARREAEGTVARFEADRRELDGLRRQSEDDERMRSEATRRLAAVQEELASTRAEADALRPVAEGRALTRAARASAEEAVKARREELERHAEELRALTQAVTTVQAAERRSGEAAVRAEGARRDLEQAAVLLAQLGEEGPGREPPSPTDRTLGEIEKELSSAVAREHEALDLLSRAKASLGQVDELLEAGICPTCHQAVRPEEFTSHREEAARTVEQTEKARVARAEERARLEEERKARERYERAHDRWAELERRRSEAREALARRTAEQDGAAGAASAATQEVEAARAAVDRLRPAEAEDARRRADLSGAERALQELAARDERMAAAEQRLRAIGTVAERMGGERLRLEAEVAGLQHRQNERGARLTALNAALSEAAQAPVALEHARTAEATADRRLAEARVSLARADTRLDGLVERLTAAERGRAERSSLIAEASDLEAKAEWVGEPFRFAVLRMEKELLAHAQLMFDRAFSRFFASLIDDPMLTARTDVSFTPEVMIAGEATPAEALSGGERTGLALAFRLALATVVRSLGAVRLETLLLDEPTDGFSSEQVVRMGELLEELALPQVVVVSHESQLAGIADRTVRVAKTDGRSSLELGGGERTTDGPKEASNDRPVPIVGASRPPRPRSR